jgi:hypothetical protein
MGENDRASHIVRDRAQRKDAEELKQRTLFLRLESAVDGVTSFLSLSLLLCLALSFSQFRSRLFVMGDVLLHRDARNSATDRRLSQLLRWKSRSAQAAPTSRFT